VAHGRPTLDTVAERASVSRMTVSNAYNHPDQLSSATRAKVLQAAAEVGYGGPDPAGRSLRRGRSGTVGVLLTERLPYAFADPGMVAFLHGVASELADAGQALLLLPAEGNPEHAQVRNAIVDAFILCSLAADEPAVAEVLARRLPVVTAGSPHLPGAPLVGIDNARAAAEVARHLLGLGHRRFGVLTVRGRPEGSLAPGPNRPAQRARVQGFQQALADAGLPPEALTVVEAQTHDRAGGAGAVRPVLRWPASRRPTALFATTDVLALGVIEAAAAVGVAVPGQLSVVGFDDIAGAAAASPPLTTVAQSLFDQGRAAARLALRLVAGEPVRAPRLRTTLVVRDSTAAAPSRRR
jgi:DNA-binding LacI/PurR family transcriptional regulator